MTVTATLTATRCSAPTAVPRTATRNAFRPRRRPPAAGWFAVLGGLLGAGVWWLTRRSLVDDAYITLAYARTLAEHGQWGMYEGLTSNAATSPLNVLLLGAATAVVRNPIWATGVVMAGVLALAGWWLHGLGRDLRVPVWRLPVFGLGLLATSPLLLSTVGLESYLAVVLMLGVARYALPRRWVAVGVVAGLLVLARPDLGIVAVLAVLLAGRRCWQVVAAGAAVVAPWLVISWVWLDSAVPDTILLKAGLSWGPWNYVTGGPGLWFPIFPAAVLMSVAPAVVGLLCLPAWWRPRLRPVGVILGGGALAHAALLATMTTAPFHWYYAPLLCGLGLLGAATLARVRWDWFPLPAAAAAAALLVVASAVTDDGLPRDRAPLASNWASAAEYQAIAAQLPTGAAIASPGEIGTLAYYCHDRCQVLDWFADRGQLTPMLEQRRADAGPIMRVFLDVNYAGADWGPPRRLDFAMRTAAADPNVATMHGSWGDGRVWWLDPATP